MTVEHRAAPGLNDMEIEIADDGQGPALHLRRAVPIETPPPLPVPESIKHRDTQTIDYCAHAHRAKSRQNA